MVSGLTVLLVDDEEGVRAMTGRVLEHWGFTVLSAEDGESALDIFISNRDNVSCVLLDMQMPGMNGSQVLLRLREIDSRIPVILSSGYPLEQIRESGGDGHAVEFIQKPYGLADLKSKLQGVLGLIFD